MVTFVPIHSARTGGNQDFRKNEVGSHLNSLTRLEVFILDNCSSDTRFDHINVDLNEGSQVPARESSPQIESCLTH